MNVSPAFTSHWKEASPFDQFARQVTSFLFPARRYIARLRSESTGDSSLTLWRDDASQSVLVYLTNQEMKREHLVMILDFLEKVSRQGFGDRGWFSCLSVNIFASKFEADFLAKLRFFSVPIQTYEWILSSNDQKETILVREVVDDLKREISPKTCPAEPEPFLTESSESLTSEELSAFVQLGMDLRKIR